MSVELASGTWTPWEEVEGPLLELYGVTPGQQYTIRLRATDAAGNVSPETVGTVTFQDDPDGGTIADSEEDFDDDGNPLTPPAARADPEAPLFCSLYRSGPYRIDADGESDVAVHGYAHLYCPRRVLLRTRPPFGVEVELESSYVSICIQKRGGLNNGLHDQALRQRRYRPGPDRECEQIHARDEPATRHRAAVLRGCE